MCLIDLNGHVMNLQAFSGGIPSPWGVIGAGEKWMRSVYYTSSAA